MDSTQKSSANTTNECGVLTNTAETVKTVKKESEGIMNCSSEEVINSCKYYLQLIDDLQGICNEEMQDDLIDSYNFFDKMYRKFNNDSTISLDERNSIRMTMKHIMRTAPEGFLWPEYNNSKKFDHHPTNLLDVLNFIRKAGPLEKRAIDLALAQKNEYNFKVSFKEGKKTVDEHWKVDSPEDFIDKLIANKKMPEHIVMERRMRYAS